MLGRNKNVTPDFSAETVVKLQGVTKDYGEGRGIFDISFEVPRGKVFGYCGTNGSGKTTTLRNIMGFIKPDKGSVSVYGVDPWKYGREIKSKIGYLPGEIAFPPVDSGSTFLKIQADLIGLKDMGKAERIINAMQLDPTANLKRMSKGMKQKTAIVAAFMNSPDLIILDEPTTGLDPLMREAFVNLIKEEKERGATIIMSNHMFDELDETCDFVGFIKNGKLTDIVDMKDIKNRPFREYAIGFADREGFDSFNADKFEVVSRDENLLVYVVRVSIKDANAAIGELKKHKLKRVNEIRYTLERYFMENVGGNTNGND